MLVEINLLQKRVKNNQLFYWLLVIVAVLVMALIATTYFVTSQLKDDIAKNEQTLNLTKATRLQLESTLQTSSLSELDKLESSIETLEGKMMDHDQLMTNLSKLLPKNSTFLSYEFSGNVILLQVNIQDDIDASYYLSHLNEQEWITNVSLINVNLGNEQSGYVAQYEITLNLDVLLENGEGDTQ
jgi:type IV pilus assembly protein PilN